MRRLNTILAITLGSTITGCMIPAHLMGRRPMEGSTHEQGLLESTARVTRMSLIPRADSLVRRTEPPDGMASFSPDKSATTTSQGDGIATLAMVGHLHATAMGVRELVRQLNSMHPNGIPAAMSREQQGDLAEMHRAAAALVGDLESSVRALDRLRQNQMTGHQ